MKILTEAGWKPLEEADRFKSNGPVTDHMGKGLRKKMVKHAQSYIDSIAGDHVWNGDDFDHDHEISHSKRLDRAQARGLMVPGRDHVAAAHAELAVDHLRKKFSKHPGFTAELAHDAALEAGHNIWGHDETKESDKYQGYKELDRKRAEARANKPPRVKSPPKAKEPWNNAGFKTKLHKPPIGGTGSKKARYALEEAKKSKDEVMEPNLLKVHNALRSGQSVRLSNGNVAHKFHTHMGMMIRNRGKEALKKLAKEHGLSIATQEMGRGGFKSVFHHTVMGPEKNVREYLARLPFKD